MVINLGAVYFYYNKYLMLDETEFETKDLLQEGLMPSFASFLVRISFFRYITLSVIVIIDCNVQVTWITIYNLKLNL